MDKAILSEDAITEIAKNLVEGVHFSDKPFRGQIEGCQIMAFDVAFRSATKRINIRDSGMRPPEPGGMWVDDLLSAACRHVFGVTRGSARKVQGSHLFEFREFWREPTRYKVIENVTVEYLTDAPLVEAKVEDEDNPPRVLKGSKKVIKVETAAFPGADIDSVVFASAYQLLERTHGTVALRWKPNANHTLLCEKTADAVTHSLVPCRYTIIRNGGSSSEIAIHIPGECTRSWDMIFGAVTEECKRLYGPGRLSYVPELGEVTFMWK